MQLDQFDVSREKLALWRERQRFYEEASLLAKISANQAKAGADAMEFLISQEPALRSDP